jgi:hypothetical protein
MTLYASASASVSLRFPFCLSDPHYVFEENALYVSEENALYVLALGLYALEASDSVEAGPGCLL